MPIASNMCSQSLDLGAVAGPQHTAFADRWNAFAAAAECSHLQQSYEHSILKSRLGWQPHFLLLERNNEICAGAALLLKRVLGRAICFATIPCGPLWRAGHLDLVPELLSEVSGFCRRENAMFCRIHPACSSEQFERLRNGIRERSKVLGSFWSYWNVPRIRMVVDIDGDPIHGMAPDTRTKVRRSEKRGVRIFSGGAELASTLAALVSQMGERKAVAVRGSEYFCSFLEAHRRLPTAIFAAEAKGKVIAAALVVAFGPSAYYLYGGFDYHERHLYPNEALQYAMMCWARKYGCVWYDMGGPCTCWPPAPDDKGYGVYRFKTQLGARPLTSAPYLDLVYRPLLYALALGAEDIGLPLLMEPGWGKFRVIANRLKENVCVGLRRLDGRR
jgi:peptidoglycan pentaglycine glycine transferase (the first glycine)